jgi:Cu2+-exporting ATPase
MSKKTCYHCGLPVPQNLDLYVNINGEDQAMCCHGCQAVAQAIIDSGLQDFYKHRTENAPTGQELVPEFLKKTVVYDNPKIQKRFVRYEGEHVREAALILEGITCAACVWLNERHLRSLNGVIDVQVNYSTHRAQVRWDNSRIQLSEILQAISAIGYIAHPYDPAQQQEILERERKQQLFRIGIAGVLTAQIMMFSIGLYFYDIETEFKTLFSWINLVLTIPLIAYVAQPFYKNAWRDVSHKQVGMDVPIVLAISLAFIGSVYTVLAASGGEVYFDSIAMFVFFLLTARYFEFIARQRSSSAAESLVHLVPTMATRLRDKQEESVLVADLEIGDIVLIRPGENVPADGIIVDGKSSIDESLLTGESYPLVKNSGQEIIAGSVNIDNPLKMQVHKIGTETVLSHILRLLERAQTEKPAITKLADQIASWFVLAVLILALSVAMYWWQSEQWLAITLSVLVVTCPCALSLATPTAITAATSTLTKIGLLTTRGYALETLARATHFVFDKTGTLTEGRLRLISSNDTESLKYAAALEQNSEHPIAKALIAAAPESNLNANNVCNYPGAGIQGDIDNKTYFLGTAAFIKEKTGICYKEENTNTLVLLADKDKIYTAFTFEDTTRAGAKQLVESLKQQGKSVSILSGDNEQAVKKIANTVGIEDIKAALTPEQKLQHVKNLQDQGKIVAMIGDGVNDAPVLAQAQISIAMGSGTQIARASADMILLTEQLPNLITGIYTARKTLNIIRQNVTWAIGYNVIALPAAAAGLVAPWMAAIGMSLSSLLVVTNALRLLKR